MANTQKDKWYQWLLHHRYGGDENQLQATMDFLTPIRDKVLANTQFAGEGIILDVGCGDGLIGFGALAKFPSTTVIFSDISADLLEHVEQIAGEMGLLNRSQFEKASAEDLSPIGTSSVDVVTLRSVLIYVHDKAQAFREFKRVLRPGGVLSLFEPINRFSFPEPDPFFLGYDLKDIFDIAVKVKHAFYATCSSEDDPMMNFDERDLIRLAEQARFSDIHLELNAGIQPRYETMKWHTFLNYTPNPNTPKMGDLINGALSENESSQFEQHMKPLIETGSGVDKFAHAYLGPG